MNKFCLLLILCLLSAWSFSQCVTTHTNREVYDFAVGDTFQYLQQPMGGYQTFVFSVIQDKHEYGSDSIVYSFIDMSSNYGSNTVTTNVSTTVIRFLDSALTVSKNGWTIDDISCYQDTGFYIYDVQQSQAITIYCSSIGQYISANASQQTTYAVGLGTTYHWSCSNTTPCNSCFTNRLIYAHKTSGVIYGNPDYSLFTSLSYQTQNASDPVVVFPNPAVLEFQLQFYDFSYKATQLKLFDAIGSEVKRFQVIDAGSVFSREGLPNGLYFWQIEVEGQLEGRGKLMFQ